MTDFDCSPEIITFCYDYDCCGELNRTVNCRNCVGKEGRGESWPCAKYKSTHSPSEIEKQYRYTDRISFNGDEHMVEYLAGERKEKSIQAIEKELG